jgi:hypothetical protein
MKKIFFFSAITMAMFFLFSLTSCQPNACCGGASGVQPQQPVVIVPPPPVKMMTMEKTITGGAKFTDGYVFECPLPNATQIEVRDRNGNHPKMMPVYDRLIVQRLDWNQGGWNYQNGPARVGGSGDLIDLVYEDGTRAYDPNYPKVVGNWVLNEFYGW